MYTRARQQKINPAVADPGPVYAGRQFHQRRDHHAKIIGHKRIQMFEPAAVSKMRFTATETADKPMIREFAAWNIAGRIVKT